MTLQVVLSERAKGVLRAIPPQTRRRLKQAISSLADDPTGKAGKLDIRALEVPQASESIFRLAVGSFRIAFTKEKRLLRVLRIFHRSEGYAWLERA
jgi:mRNA interferase RelE/StbE